MVTDETMPYANSLTYSLSYPKSRDAIASKNPLIDNRYIEHSVVPETSLMIDSISVM